MLDALAEASYSRDRRGHLARANVGLEKLRFLMRLAFDRRHLDVHRYEHAARTIDEVGCLIGGWAKAHAAHAGSSPPQSGAAQRGERTAMDRLPLTAKRA